MFSVSNMFMVVIVFFRFSSVIVNVVMKGVMMLLFCLIRWKVVSVCLGVVV